MLFFVSQILTEKNVCCKLAYACFLSGARLAFCDVTGEAFVTSSESLAIYCKRSNTACFWQVLVHFRVFSLCRFLNHYAAEWHILKTPWLWNPVTSTFLNLTFFNKLLIDSWCSISKSQSSPIMVSNALWEWSQMTSQCVRKFQFASVFIVFPLHVQSPKIFGCPLHIWALGQHRRKRFGLVRNQCQKIQCGDLWYGVKVKSWEFCL